MKKVTYIISDINKASAFEWISETINLNEFSLSFILLNSNHSDLEKYLVDHKFPVVIIPCKTKADWPAAFLKIFRELRKTKPDIVHCHMLQASFLGLSAALFAGVKRRIFTRHHSSEHHTYFRKGVWWDKCNNLLATHIVAISGIVRKILIDWEKVAPSKIVWIPHGFKLEEFSLVSQDRIDRFKNLYNIQEKRPVIGVISRFTEWKGIQYTIDAFVRFLKEQPQAVLLLMNATGDYEGTILDMVSGLPKESYRLIKFENDIAAAYRCMDVFVHVPITEHSEAFGQVYVEALASGVPSVFTTSGIATDFILDHVNALVVPFRSADAIYQALKETFENKELREKLIVNGKVSAEQFDLSVMMQKLEHVYAG